MKKILKKIPGVGSAIGLGEALFDGVTGALDTGVGLVSATLQGIPFFGSTTTSDEYDHNKVDEKHYFLIPDRLSEQGYSLYVMRCLPAGVPPINDLPKQRLIHLPGENALPMLQNIMMAEAREQVETAPKSGNFISDNLTALANEIDKVDEKAFGGVLLLGGLVTLINPLAGAAVAANALIPSVGLIASKYGLKIASGTATNMDMARKIKRAEKDVVKQFKAANTAQVINPLLVQLARAYDGDLALSDEMLDFQCDDIELSATDIGRLLSLTEEAIRNLGDDEDGQTLKREPAQKTYLDTLNMFVRKHMG